MEKFIYEALYHYKDDDGEEGYDLFCVQTLEHKEKERIDVLKKILENEDRYIAYQAMIILLSWGLDEGFVKLNEFITDKWYEKAEFEPHRIYGEDNVFDVIADALDIAWFNSMDKKRVIDLFKVILSYYGNMFFEGKIKQVLLKREELAMNILPNIKNALEASLKNKRFYQASQLLSIINKYDKKYVEMLIPEFENLAKIDSRINYNLDEILIK
jgi:hypothetical protein